MVWCQNVKNNFLKKRVFFQMFSSNKVTGMSEIQGMKECLKKCLLAVCWMQVMAVMLCFSCWPHDDFVVSLLLGINTNTLMIKFVDIRLVT